MLLKNQLRNELQLKRKAIVNKNEKDKAVCRKLLNSIDYKQADIILFYAALADEINIDECITKAISDGKKAALPVCIDDAGNMEFYYINSLDNIKIGSFGVREPDILNSAKVTEFDNSLCIVPAIAYDRSGCRLGYGKGYYDRFLGKYDFISIGLCYNELVVEKLPTDKFDIPVDKIITENGFLLI